jgi:DivIVA domain-containing protein
MPDGLDSDDIARRTFEVKRRGYEQQEVRAFLHELSSLVARLRREGDEMRERALRAEAALERAGTPDEAMLLERLGEETTSILTSARESAAEIRTKAELAAERIVADATLDAAEARAEAMRGVDRRVIEAEAERESLLREARTELERRRAEAEEVASRLRVEAAEEIEALREQGQRDLAHIHASADDVLEAARAQGREMVVEAQAVRERVLRDLAVRRKKARRQVEKLNAGRDRLLQAYEVLRHLIDEATDELGVSAVDARLAAEAAERQVEDESETSFEDLDPDGVPLATDGDGKEPEALDADDADGAGPDIDGDAAADQLVQAAVPPEETPRAGPDVAGRRRKGRRRKGAFVGLPPGMEAPGPTTSVRLVDAEPGPSGDPGSHLDMAERVVAERVEAERVEAERVEAERVEAERVEAERVEAERVEAERVEAERVEAERVEAERVEAERVEAERVEAERLKAERAAVAVSEAERAAASRAADAAADAGDSPAVSDLFVRLRAEWDAPRAAVEEVGADEPATEEPEPEVDRVEATPFTARAAALEPIVHGLNRVLKRALADEQNEALDRLRRAKPKGVDDVLPSPDDHAARWAQVSVAALAEAAEAGAGWGGGRSGSVADLADEMARALTSPLRERIDRGFAASDGNLEDVADRVRALYREWKGQRLAEMASHYAGAAYARGLYDALGVRSRVHWVIDPAGDPCPDCDDNVLGGTLERGTEFPTGHQCAPAHPGCRCLVLATDD